MPGITIKQNVTVENGIWTGTIDPPDNKWQYFGQTLLDRLKRVPERVGQIDGLTGKEDTYGAIVDRAVRCALWLRGQGLHPGDFIGLCTNNQLDTVVPALAAIFTGVVFHPWWHICIDDDMIRYFLRLGEPKVMFVSKTTAAAVQEGINDLGMSTKLILLEDLPGSLTLQDILRTQNPTDVENFTCTSFQSEHQPACMMLTSGTTGYPKGVLHSCSWLQRFWLVEERYMADSTVFWSASICWITGLMCTIRALTTCATAVIYPDVTVEIMCQLVQRYKIESIITSARVANHLSCYENAKTHDMSSLKYIGFAGGIVTEDVERTLRDIFPTAQVGILYGLTEVGVTISRCDVPTKFRSIGRICRNWRTKVIDCETGATLGSNEKGEICFKSSFMMQEYHKNGKGLEAMDADGWFHSGDLGYCDDEGNFSVLDRMREVIKYKQGIHLTPSSIEEAIQKHPNIIDVAVVAKPDLLDLEVPMAFVTIRPGSKLTEAEVVAFAENNLPEYMRPHGGVRILDKIPTTASGKISKTRLREMAKNGDR